MNQALLFGLIGALVGGGLGVLIAIAPDEGEIFIASDQPITVAQVHEKLRADGWSNVQIAEMGRYLEIAGSKHGQSRKLMVDTLSGHLIADDDD
jgi:ABC-type lipoprotein release transport system permease subunit